MEHRKKFDLKFIIKVIVIIALSIKGLSFLYDSSFGRYSAKQEQTRNHQGFIDELKYDYPNVSNVVFDRGNLEITVDVTQKIDAATFKESMTFFICERFTNREAVININARYSVNAKYPKSGKLLASWLLFAKKCT